MSIPFQSAFRGKVTIPLIEEDHYQERMSNAVEPMLKLSRNHGFLTLPGKIRIHYEYYLNSDPIGAVVICHGFTESAEKFREMTYYFLQAGYSVFACDHRGHGRSTREVPEYCDTHISKFSDYVNDFDAFVKRIVRPNAVNLPLYLYAHSMGGAIGAEYLAQHPVVFRKAILTSPMIAASTRGIPRPLARALPLCFKLIGKGKARCFLFGPYDETEDGDFKHSNDNSEERFEYYRKKRKNNEKLQNTAATYSWVNESLGVTGKILNRKACAAVQTKVLLFQAENDSLVMPDAQKKYIARIPHGDLVFVPGVKHEIYLSKNETLGNYLETVLRFLTK